MQIVDLNSSSVISDEVLAIQCAKSAVLNDNLEFMKNILQGLSDLLTVTKV